MPEETLLVNGQKICSLDYVQYHRKRIDRTLVKLREIRAKKIVEVGGHPWAMTAALIDHPDFEVCATVSAEELVRWPDDIGVERREFCLKTPGGKEAVIVNYSANVERTLFDIQETPDTVLACEIVEHLIRSPHVMFLNINRWLPIKGKLFITTPNGAQFSNPLRRKSPTPAHRSNVYERHSYIYTIDELVDLVALCGFKVLEMGYWDVHDRQGFSSIYTLLSRIPLKYFKDKFMKTIFLVGEKERAVRELERPPRVYDARGQWEFIRHEPSA